MGQIHRQARTTPRTRAGSKAASRTLQEVADRDEISLVTVRKRKRREEVEDCSHSPHRLSTTLTPGQEVLVAELLRTLLRPLDDLPVVTRQVIKVQVSRSGLDRCLRRHGVAQLRDFLGVPEGETSKVKTFKDYEPGFVRVDIKCLLQMPDASSSRCVFVAIDRATFRHATTVLP